MRRGLEQLMRGEDGMETLEWAILGATVAITCLFVFAGLGYTISGIAIDLANLF